MWYFLRFLIFVISTIFLQACKKEPKCEVMRDHFLYVYMTIQPEVKRINLGDTLLLRLHIPDKQICAYFGTEVDVSKARMSASGIDLLTYELINDSVHITGNTFELIRLEGTFSNFNNVRINATFSRNENGFVFVLKVIPTRQGLVRLANYRAEGWLNGKCIKINFAPLISNASQNLDLLSNINRFASPATYPWPNHYFVWVD